MEILIYFLIILVISIYASYEDIKRRNISNLIPIFILLCGIMYRLLNNSTDFIIPTIYLLFLGYGLWLVKSIGGADAKMLCAYAPILPYHGFANMFVIVVLFSLIWGILTSLYALMFIKLSKKKCVKKIPLIPIFPLSLIITYLILYLIPIR